MNDIAIDRFGGDCHRMTMRSRVFLLVCRLGLILAVVSEAPQFGATWTGVAFAASPTVQRDTNDPMDGKRIHPTRAAVHDANTPTAPAKPRRDRHKSPGYPAHSAKPLVPDPKAHVVPVVPLPSVAPKPAPKPSAREPGEPIKLPRFAALKTDETNMRVGPGTRYPIEWVYRRRDLPMEVEKEYDVWRYVRDPEGVRGWVHQVTLSERRTFMVRGTDATIRTEANDGARAVAVLKVGVIGRLRACDDGSKWCQVQIGTFKGYLRRDQFWGLLPNEVVAPS